MKGEERGRDWAQAPEADGISGAVADYRALETGALACVALFPARLHCVLCSS